MTEAPQARPKGFEVAPWIDRAGGFIERHVDWWIKLGSIETALLDGTLADVRIDRPIYVTGLARSGTTILLEALARHPDAVTHRYRDFPFLFTPYLWNRWLDLVPRKPEKPAGRSHNDGIAVTSESPEAFEESLWMAFFPGQHDPSRSALMDRSGHHPAFERFYRDHIRKLLAVRRGCRYVAKGNYNLTRIPYLAKMFPDARFVVPVRDPVWHVASLMKQHRLFLAGQRDNPPALRHLRRVGHFEFGEDRRPVNLGDDAAAADIAALWRAGEEVRGWARYWSQVHRHILDLHDRAQDQQGAMRVVRYEDLCAAPRAVLEGVLAHCGLAGDGKLLSSAAERFHPPGYYRPSFTAAELATIAEETAAVALRFGYAPAAGRRQSAQ